MFLSWFIWIYNYVIYSQYKQRKWQEKFDYLTEEKKTPPVWTKVFILFLILIGILFLYYDNIIGFIFLILGLHFFVHWMHYYFIYESNSFLLLIVKLLEYLINKWKN